MVNHACYIILTWNLKLCHMYARVRGAAISHIINDVLPDPPRGGWQLGSMSVCICVHRCVQLHQCVPSIILKHTRRMEMSLHQSIRQTYNYWHTHRMERILISLRPSIIYTAIGIHKGWRRFSFHSIHPSYIQLLEWRGPYSVESVFHISVRILYG